MVVQVYPVVMTNKTLFVILLDKIKKRGLQLTYGMLIISLNNYGS